MRVTTSEGRVFKGATPQSVVRKMANAGWMHDQPKGEYVTSVQRRVEGITGKAMTRLRQNERPRSKAFLLDLEELEFVRLS